MIAEWVNSNAATAAGMVGITSDDIRSFSKGEVYRARIDFSEDEGLTDTSLKGTIDDPEIFGQASYDNLAMGHIELAKPIVNIQYLRGSNPILPKALGMKREDIEEILYDDVFVATEDTEGFSVGQIICLDDYRKCKNKEYLVRGPEAIQILLEKKNVPDRDCMILTALPVLPLCMRALEMENGEWAPTPINILYNSLLLKNASLNNSNRVSFQNIMADLLGSEFLDALDTDELSLQEEADALISNGAYGYPSLGMYGEPIESLAEVYAMISGSNSRKFVVPKLNSDFPEIPERAAEIIRELNAEPSETSQEGLVDFKQMVSRMMSKSDIKAELIQLLGPFISYVIQTYFGEYQDFTDEMKDFAELAAERAIRDIDPEKELKAQFIGGIFNLIRLFCEKQSRFS